MKGYGIIGYPLLHSFSPAYFARKFEALGIDASYQIFELENIVAFPSLLQQHPYLQGLNVTIPYKRSIVPYLDELDEDAAAIGSVNCISISGGKTKGYNTDHTGFRKSLEPLLQPQHNKALILGTGGSSYAVAYALDRLGIAYQKVSRTKADGTLTYNELDADLLSNHPLIINTTPVGMHPRETECPLASYEGIGNSHLLYDLIYNPALTEFLRRGSELGAAVKNGLEMLHIQAEASWEIWNS